MTTHDYSKRGWGHDYFITDVAQEGLVLKAGGWGDDIESGDFLILQDQKGGTTRYKVVTIRYESDPTDMWWATLEFAPRANGGHDVSCPNKNQNTETKETV